MISWQQDIPIYLYREVVDFRKSPFDVGIFVFCNRRRDKIKVLYWDSTGFALWYKRLEKDKFKWPRKVSDDVLLLTGEQWSWLLRGLNFLDIKPHQEWPFFAVN
jgi:transposase